MKLWRWRKASSVSRLTTLISTDECTGSSVFFFFREVEDRWKTSFPQVK